jgi:hypothetical protein
MQIAYEVYQLTIPIHSMNIIKLMLPFFEEDYFERRSFLNFKFVPWLNIELEIIF